jgi:hypothetical protein
VIPTNCGLIHFTCPRFLVILGNREEPRTMYILSDRPTRFTTPQQNLFLCTTETELQQGASPHGVI